MELINQTYASFGKYVNYSAEDKSVNAHNCRKSAILSQLHLLHKLVSDLGLKELDHCD